MLHNLRMSTDDSNGKKGFFPFDPSAFAKIKLGHGVTGKTAYIAAFSVIGLIILAVIFALAGQYQSALMLAGAMIIVAVLACWKIFDFAEKYPQAALLEGAEFVQWTQIQQAAKDPQIIEIKAAPTANTSPPLSISSGGD
jgi:hypothetical protein